MSCAVSNNLTLVKYSAMTQLIDGFTRLPLMAENALFSLNESPAFPQPRAEGVYVFSNLITNKYSLTIQAKYFFEAHTELNLNSVPDLRNSIYTVVMQPTPAYPYPPGLTLLRGMVVNEQTNQPLSDVEIFADYPTQWHKDLKASTKTAQQGRYKGRYALPFKGRLADKTSVNLLFKCDGYKPFTTTINLQRAVTRELHVQMQPS